MSQGMDQTTGLIVSLEEEDLGLSKLASENDQRASVSFCHLELIRFELGFLGELNDNFLVLPLQAPRLLPGAAFSLVRWRCLESASQPVWCILPAYI